MNCSDIGFGTYNCAYNIMLPWLVSDPCNPEAPPASHTIAVDKCLLPEVLGLWELGIKTTGCCCGHGKQAPFIGVCESDIEKMKSMRYEVVGNPCRPNAEDSFLPKTKFLYGDADKGHNWWNKH